MSASTITAAAPDSATVGPETDSVRRQRRLAQRRWAAVPVGERLRVLRAARLRLAAQAEQFAQLLNSGPARTVADSLAAEVLPLLEACRFLEKNAAPLLRTRRLGRRGLPFWLNGIDSRIERVPFGTVLVIGPGNYPLLLPGVQALQALAAGNAVIWKPGRGGGAVALLFAEAMRGAGLPDGLLRVTGESVADAEQAVASGVDKVFFTGSATSGRALLRRLAEQAVPCVAELSGCDAVVVLPSADLSRVVHALSFGMRLNGSATCMAPRRVLLVDADERRRQQLEEALRTALAQVRGVPLPAATQGHLVQLTEDAAQHGATVLGDPHAAEVRPVLVLGAHSGMAIASADIFAPVLAVLPVHGHDGVVAAHDACEYALTTSIFGDEEEARTLAMRLEVGTVLINDLVVPTADPRVPFGGRRGSGFGVTRGEDGLWEMTAVRVVAARRGDGIRHYEAPTPLHDDLIGGIVQVAHAGTWRERWQGLRRVIAAGRRMNGH